MISKELLGDVLDKKIMHLTHLNNFGDITFVLDDGWHDYMNIYELSHLCKRSAWVKHQITIRSGYAEFGAWSNFAHNDISFVSMDIPLDEPEAIFKAYQWILENKAK